MVLANRGFALSPSCHPSNLLANVFERNSLPPTQSSSDCLGSAPERMRRAE
ncbi:predicted protein [Chaetomium globosum CBS 148.51]|uniref:Uncharacterized protein n=1 Tax=Chaetomium globosum (strain ATCC 6205 / CBS 148.51 / DSM 1962 / NBRC 6347 / NRRL 1970) TaxID=306901 RepID=Q2H963_CHAGB|nr:uncharacterized protein CHGG_03241 [Chaetomium globosum CBS 148.51]EAQ91306.1 predicted protein [Chaetomium globosum CBS 148.51]